MFRVEPLRLWLGHAGDCRDTLQILDAEIRAVVQLALEEPPADFPRDLISIRIPLHDGFGNSADDLRLAVHAVAQLLRSETPTLICCGAGMSRSPAIAACALSCVDGRSPSECLEWLRSRHGTDVSATLWHDLLSCLPF